MTGGSICRECSGDGHGPQVQGHKAVKCQHCDGTGRVIALNGDIIPNVGPPPDGPGGDTGH